ncbi:DEAD/DEAH box helicase [Flavobacterium sp.]|uniref:DEAD/DEAH box helicase n=1 Tax=Flavobacterium sp. TaxID=239 RepID=UPI00260EF975|nr:DEAD/DEAH box helicase [Flavobacterium sp.]
MNRKDQNREKLQLSNLKKDKFFQATFQKLNLENKDFDDSEKEYLLSCAIILFKFYENDKRYKTYFKLGYYIILKYSILFNDYKPLYDICLQIGFYPISSYILKNKLIEFEENNFADLYLNKIIDNNYKSSENYIESLEQNKSVKSILQNNYSKNIAYIAPTSYGKSSLIKDYIKKFEYSRIGIIVPTKSLLLQTYNDIKKLNLSYKLILHDEMYQGETKFIGILTQERATRILNNNEKAFFDIIFIDEAHKILERDSRSYILSRLIQLNFFKNQKQKIIYLSPLIDETDNLKIKTIDETTVYTRKINYDLKASEVYLYHKFKSFLYDKFTHKYIDLNIKTNFYDYIIKNSKSKNFIYHHKPKKIQELSLGLFKNEKPIKNEKILNVINTLRKEVHNSFYAVELLEKGIVYIHAKIPNIIKEYLEFQFKTIAEIKYIIANQVILEGINLPIETIFITSSRANEMKGKELINLIGRVNRLNYVFNSNNLNQLISKIHFLNSEPFQGARDIRKTIELLRNQSFEDKIENPLIENYEIEKLKLSEARKEKHEKEDTIIISSSEFILIKPSNRKDFLKKYFIENSIDDFFYDLEVACENIIKNIDVFKFEFSIKVVDIINNILIKNNVENIRDFEVERLKNDKATNYYNYFLEITQKQALNERINSTFKYFKEKANSNDPFLFIGETYGDEIRISEKYKNNKYNREVYINLSNKKDKELINLAIVKLKIEEDFVSFKLNKLIIFLYDFDIISEEYYLLYIYGTTEKKLIDLVRFGLSINLIKQINEDGEMKNLYLDKNGNLNAKKEFNNYLENQSELFKFEIRKYLN